MFHNFVEFCKKIGFFDIPLYYDVTITSLITSFGNKQLYYFWNDIFFFLISKRNKHFNHISYLIKLRGNHSGFYQIVAFFIYICDVFIHGQVSDPLFSTSLYSEGLIALHAYRCCHVVVVAHSFIVVQFIPISLQFLEYIKCNWTWYKGAN